MSTDSTTGHAFISYVSEDSERIDVLQEFLEAEGIRVWRDRNEISPGDDWRAEIRQAIRQGCLVFIACFSENSDAREKSYQREELVLAAEEFRSRRPDQPWIFPVRFDDVEIPEYDLGAGRMLDSRQPSDLFGNSWEGELSRLAASIKRVIPTGDGEPPDRPNRRPGRTGRLLAVPARVNRSARRSGHTSRPPAGVTPHPTPPGGRRRRGTPVEQAATAGGTPQGDSWDQVARTNTGMRRRSLARLLIALVSAVSVLVLLSGGAVVLRSITDGATGPAVVPTWASTPTSSPTPERPDPTPSPSPSPSASPLAGQSSPFPGQSASPEVPTSTGAEPTAGTENVSPPAGGAVETGVGKRCLGGEILRCTWVNYDPVNGKVRAYAQVDDAPGAHEYLVKVNSIQLVYTDPSGGYIRVGDVNLDNDDWNDQTDTGSSSLVGCDTVRNLPLRTVYAQAVFYWTGYSSNHETRVSYPVTRC